MKKTYVLGAITGMGFGFPVTLLCMSLFGGYNVIVQEFLVWMVASALYGLLSVILFDRKNDLPQMAVLGLHFVGVTAITIAAALLNGYVSSFADVLPILIPTLVIYVVITGVCAFLNKKTEKQINKALDEK
ncbi:MAG: DUF3021 domain-containing protein [Clostridiales bacterium]|nr:DUF3021 domain-containing protein [Clostridiales bacterium]